MNFKENDVVIVRSGDEGKLQDKVFDLTLLNLLQIVPVHS